MIKSNIAVPMTEQT